MKDVLLIAVMILGAYIAGSCNFSIVLFKILGKGDPRQKFSGNAGATNVYRQAGLGWALLVLLLDGVRAIAVSLIAMYFLELRFVPWVGLSLILGNRYPCFHGFSGGKGVANYLGFSIAIIPIFSLISILAWVILYTAIKLPFLSSFAMIMVLGAGMIMELRQYADALTGIVLTVLLILIAHKTNVMEFIHNKKNKSNDLHGR